MSDLVAAKAAMEQAIQSAEIIWEGEMFNQSNAKPVAVKVGINEWNRLCDLLGTWTYQIPGPKVESPDFSTTSARTEGGPVGNEGRAGDSALCPECHYDPADGHAFECEAGRQEITARAYGPEDSE